MSYHDELLKHVPWVKVLKEEVPCEGIKWGTVALKDLYDHGPDQSRTARGIQDKSRCKKKARWHYRALKPRGDHRDWGIGTSGNYCWHHLAQQIQHDKELRRFNTWANRNESLISRLKREINPQ